jgi:hypothetical protein
VFWDACDPAGRRCTIRYSVGDGMRWSVPREPDQPPDARHTHPCTALDADGNLLLFYLVRTAGGWQLRYLQVDASDPEATPDFSTGTPFPLHAGQDPRVEDEPFVLEDPGHADGPGLWVFWVRREPSATNPGRFYKTIAYRHLVLDTGWGPVLTWPKSPGDPDYNDSAPSAVVHNGLIRLFWTTDRHGNRTIMQAALGAPGDALELTSESPYTCTASLPVEADALPLLIYRSNECIVHQSAMQSITQSADRRYAGGTSHHTSHVKKNTLAGTYDDFQTRTYDTGRKTRGEDMDLYSRETVGLYLSPDVFDPAGIETGVARLKGVLGEFIPITARPVIIPHVDTHSEFVYRYEAGTGAGEVIRSSASAEMTAPVIHIVPTPADGFEDS